MGDVFTIEINMELKCKECHKGGATPSGFCMACVSKAISDKTMKTVEGRAFKTRVQADLKRQAKDLKKRRKSRQQPTAPALFDEVK